MGAGRKTKTIHAAEDSRLAPSEGANCSAAARNLRKNNLGGVIFGCKHSTMNECLGKLLFGLPYSHFSYVKNIDPGLPLFLFNYSDRTMHGVFEAASHGRLYIDPYAWTEDGREKTQFSSQVRVLLRLPSQSVSEKQFKDVIQDNYYTERHFWFELDHTQTNSLMSLFRSSSIPSNIKQARLTLNKFDNPSALLSKKKTIDIQEKSNMTSLEIETKTSTKPRSMNKFELLGAHDDGDTEENVTVWGDQYQLSNTSRASSSVHDEMDFKEKVVNWGDYTTSVEVQNDNMGAENDNNLGSHSIDLHLNGDNGKLLVQHESPEPSEPDMDKVLRKLKEISVEQETSSLFSKDPAPCISYDTHKTSKTEESKSTTDLQPSELAQIIKALTDRTEELEKKQAESEKQLHQLRDTARESEMTLCRLRDQVNELETKIYPSTSSGGTHLEQHLVPEQVIYLIGGYDGSSCLSAFDTFSPSSGILTPLQKMSCVRSYSSAAALDGNLFILGGGDGTSWYSSVECYDLGKNEWISCPNLNQRKGSLAGVTLDNKIYAIGGGDGIVSLADVEMFDPILGRWINSQSMLQKRFAAAAVEHNGALYAVGGFDGKEYMMSAERYDPREGYWTRLASLTHRRGCHSLSVLRGKIYAVGGFDGKQMISSVEVLDPRFGSWEISAPLNVHRGYASGTVVGDTLFVIGGLDNEEKVRDTVECFQEGGNWSACHFESIGKRCFMATITL